MPTISAEEAQLLSVHRAIKKFAHPELVDVTDLGHLVEGLNVVLDIPKYEEELTANELKSLILGFVAGVAITRIGPPDPEYYSEPTEGHFIGGVSGGTALEQGTDPAFVVQSGLPADSE